MEPDPDPPASLQAPGFMFVFGNLVVLEPDADSTWGVGPLRIEHRGESVDGHQSIDIAKVPAALAALSGIAVTLYGPRGRVCAGRLGELALFGHQRSNEPSPAEPTELPSRPRLVAALTATDRACDGALWARKSDLPPPIVYARDPKPPAAVIARAIAAAKLQPRFRDLQRSHTEFLAEVEPDDRKEVTPWKQLLAKHLRTSLWRSPARSIAIVELGDPEAVSCDLYFTGSLTLVFEVKGDALTLLSADGSWRTNAVFDVEADGVLELFARPAEGAEEMVSILTSNYREVDGLYFPYEEDC